MVKAPPLCGAFSLMLAHLDEGNASLVLPVMDLRRTFTFRRARRPGRIPNKRLRHKPPLDHAKRPRSLSE
jgi:hypothetical protein